MAAQKMFLFFPLTRCWLKFWEEGLVEIRMLNGNNVLLLTKCEVWERGGIFNQICDQQRNGASFLWFHSLYQAAVERIFLSFLELQSTLESLLVFLVLCVCVKPFLVFRLISDQLQMLCAYQDQFGYGQRCFLQAHPKHIKGRGKVCVYGGRV